MVLSKYDRDKNGFDSFEKIACFTFIVVVFWEDGADWRGMQTQCLPESRIMHAGV